MVRSESVSDRLALVMGDLTWQAYNDWGGRSTYWGPAGRQDRSRAVSFSHPYANGHGTGKYLRYAQPVVSLAEEHGLKVSYVAMSDLEADRSLLAGAEGVVFLGHAEYGTVNNFNDLLRLRDAGTDITFLGANSLYWRVRIKQKGPGGQPLQVLYKSASEDPVQGAQTTTRFRDAPGARPERQLVGQECECYPAEGTLKISNPNFFAYEGTKVRKGDRFYKIVGVEVDRAYPGAPTPANLQIVADASVKCGPFDRATTSTMTYYSVPSGAGVFSTGSMAWVLRGVRGTAPRRSVEFSRKVTVNLFEAMLDGRMGAKHPSVPNLNSYELSEQNLTGAA